MVVLIFSNYKSVMAGKKRYVNLCNSKNKVHN
jgi:hypothetical protein